MQAFISSDSENLLCSGYKNSTIQNPGPRNAKKMRFSDCRASPNKFSKQAGLECKHSAQLISKIYCVLKKTNLGVYIMKYKCYDEEWVNIKQL